MVTDKMKECLNTLNTKFNYLNAILGVDPDTYIKTIPLDEVLKGTHDDYSLRLLKLITQESKFRLIKELLIGSADLHYVKVPDQHGGWVGHCVLEYRGYYIDNNFRNYGTKDSMIRKGGYRFRYPYTCSQLFFKYLQHKVIKFFKYF